VVVKGACKERDNRLLISFEFSHLFSPVSGSVQARLVSSTVERSSQSTSDKNFRGSPTPNRNFRQEKLPPSASKSLPDLRARRQILMLLAALRF
jgi:hypothetical protein